MPDAQFLLTAPPHGRLQWDGSDRLWLVANFTINENDPFATGRGVWLYQDGAGVKIMASGDPAPGTKQRFEVLAFYNHVPPVAFQNGRAIIDSRVSALPEEDEPPSVAGIWTATQGSLSKLVVAGEQMAGQPEAVTIYPWCCLAVSPAGDFAYEARGSGGALHLTVIRP